MLIKEKFFIEGMHCGSCKTLIETELDILPGVTKADVNYLNGEIEIEYEKEKISLDRIFSTIKSLGYKASKQKKDKQKGRKILFIIGAIVFIYLMIAVIDNFGGFELMSKLNEGTASFWLILIIGFLASFHCVGMCGGLVVAYSANDLKEGRKNKLFKPHFQYNLGRLISYTFVGAVLGGIGSFFAINPSFTGFLTIFVGLFMVLMGLSFLSEGRIFSKVKIKPPEKIARFLYNQKRSDNPKGPFIIGILNGFMPCGPLQAMQLFALGTGSLAMGALAMFTYALGTIPLMFGLGVFLSKIGSAHVKNVMKVSGILVIILGLFMGMRGLSNFGIGFSKNEADILVEGSEEFQEVRMDLTYLGYEPNVLYIKPNTPVRWIINVKQMTGCTDAIMIESLGIEKDLVKGENIIEFDLPKGVSEIKFSCWMRMVWGKFVILQGGQGKKEVNASGSDIQQGGCGGNCGSNTCAAARGLPCGCGSR
ncbi:hypothetical protein GF382_00330 [Candidatus Falkowbacteria bacterium]|nr:hypothetical protein [Candidatus Falkowbacteria bacterium]